MSLTTVNGAILIPTPPDWSSQVSGSRRWEVRTSQALDGSEDRIGVRYNSLRSLQFTPKLMDQSERSRFMDRIRAAVKLGQAAVPYWGRGRELAADVSGTALQIDSGSAELAVGDYVLFLDWTTDPEDWDCIEISAKSSATNYTLDSSVSRTYSATSYCWPILFGRIETNDADLLDDYRGKMQVRFMEPQGAGDLLDAATSCGAAPAASTAGTVTFCEGSITLSVDTSGCAGAYDLSWTKLEYADQYVIKRGASGGPYSTVVATVSDLSYSVNRPWLDDEYYVVVGQIGSYEVTSNEVTLPAITVESLMRAVQERYYAAIGSYYTWPSTPFDRVSDGTPPGNYPADGFYDPDLPDAAREVALLQGIADVFVASPYLLRRYLDLDETSLLTLHGVNVALPYFEDSSGTRLSPFNALPMTVASGTRSTQARTLASYCCLLQFLGIEIVTGGAPSHGEMIFSTYESRISGISGGGAEASVGLAQATLSTDWDAAAWSSASSGSGPGPWNAGVYSEVLPDGTGLWVGNYVSYRFNLQGPLSGYGSSGDVILYFALTTDQLAGGPVPFTAGNNPPSSMAVDELFRSIETDSLPITTFTSEQYASQKPVTPGASLTIGWNLYEAVLLVVKRKDPDLGNWDYFP